MGDSTIQVFVIESPAEVRLGESVTYTYAAYNGGPTGYLVTARAISDAEVTLALEPSHLFLGPQENGQFTLALQAPVIGLEDTFNVFVDFQAVNLVTDEVDSLRVGVQTILLGISVERDPTGKVFGIWPNPLPSPLNNPYGAFTVTVGLWILIALAVVYVVGPITRKFAERTVSQVADVILGVLRGPAFALVLLYGAVTSVQILAMPENIQFLLSRSYSFLLILVLTWIAYKVFRDVFIFYGRRLSERSPRDIGARLVPALDKIGGLVIIIIGLVFAAGNAGIDVTLFLAGIGVVGLIIAFAAQDTLSNFFAGLHIMLDRPFQVGDLIEVETGVICEVVDIGLRSTKLYWGKEHDLLIIPNKELAEKKIVNYLRPDLRYKVMVKIGVAYGSDLAKVERVMKDIVLAHADVITDEEHAPDFRVDEFGDSSINCRIIFWIHDARAQWRVRSDINKAIDRRFREEDISIPFPQRDLWVKETPRGGSTPLE